MNRLARGALAVQSAALYGLLVLLPFSKAAIEVLFGVLLAGGIIRMSAGGFASSIWSRPQWRGLAAAVGCFALWCGLTTFWSSNQALSARGFVGKTLEYLAYFLLVADLAPSAHLARRARVALLVSVAVVVAHAWVAHVMGYDPLRARRYIYPELIGPYENPIDLAIFLMTVLPCLLVLAAAAPARHRWWSWGIAGIAAVSLILTKAEWTWGGLLIGLVLVAWMRPQWRTMIGGSALLVVAVGLVQLVSTGYLWTLLTFSTAGVQDRAYMWAAGWNMVHASPWIGNGLNTFMDNYLRNWVGGPQMPRYAHNCYLQLWAETGAVGLVAFIWVIGGWLHRCLDAIRHGGGLRAVLLLGWCAGLTAFLVHAAVDTDFYGLRHAALFWVLAGLCVAMAAQLEDGASHPIDKTAILSDDE